jgi:hypothetical protein
LLLVVPFHYKLISMMKHSILTLLLLFCLSFVQAQPCAPSELVSISAQLDSPCEAMSGTSTYFNFATIWVQRNFIRVGPLLWQFRTDTVSGLWQTIPGQVTEGLSITDFNTSNNGQYRCVFTDAATGCTDIKKIYLKVNPRPSFNISVDSTDCGGLYLGTAINNLGNQVLTHCWEPAGPPPSACGASGPAYHFGGVGCAAVTGTVTVIVTNQYGCENLEFISGVCNLEYLDTYAALNAPDTFFCAKSANIEVRRISNTSVQAGWTYQWLRNGSALSWATNRSIKPVSSGTYKCIVTNNIGCTQTTNEISVTVNPLPAVIIQPSGTNEICSKDTIVMSSGSHSANTFAWYRNGQLLPQNTLAIGVHRAGSYKVVVTTPAGCSATSTISKITEYRSKIVTNDPVIFCQGDSAVLIHTTPNTASIQWRINNTNIPGATLNTFAATQSGLYRVKSTSIGGCISFSNQIDISVNCREGLAEEYLLRISPVPSAHFINLGMVEPVGEYRIVIMDMNGKVVFENNNSQLDVQQLDISGLSAGMYLIHYSDEMGMRSGKFIRE